MEQRRRSIYPLKIIRNRLKMGYYIKNGTGSGQNSKLN
jgi:hypothetical protein